MFARKEGFPFIAGSAALSFLLSGTRMRALSRMPAANKHMQAYIAIGGRLRSGQAINGGFNETFASE